MSLKHNKDELGFSKSTITSKAHIQFKWNVLWVTKNPKGVIEINFGFKETEAAFSVDTITKFCVSKATLNALLNDPVVTVLGAEPYGSSNWSNFMESADMSYFWQRRVNEITVTDVQVPQTKCFTHVHNVPQSVLQPYYPKSTSSSSSSSVIVQRKSTILASNKGKKDSVKSSKIVVTEKKGETRSSSRVYSKNRIEALKKNEENSCALYSQKEFEEILEEELKENEDVEDGDNTGPSDTAKDSETIDEPGTVNSSTKTSDTPTDGAEQENSSIRTNSIVGALTTTTLFFVDGFEVEEVLYNRSTQQTKKSTRVVQNDVVANDSLRCCCLRSNCLTNASGSPFFCVFSLKRAHAECIGNTNECSGCIKRNTLRSQFEINGLQAVIPSIRATVDFNIVRRQKCSAEIEFGILTFDGYVFPDDAAMHQVTFYQLSARRLKEVKALPIRIDKQQPLKESWVDYLFNKNSKVLWYFNNWNGSVTKTHISVRIRGGFQTRQGAINNKVAVTDMKEFNNNGTTLEYRDLPRDFICGLQGFCAVIAAYYICLEMTMAHVESLKNLHHTEMQIDSSSSIFVTNGTYTVVDNINALQAKSKLKCIFPTKENLNLTGSLNFLFRNSSSCGKFLVELKDKACSVDNDVSHFVSFDTHKMEIYDPMCERGAIVAQRSMNDTCLFLESLQLHDVVYVIKIWELVDVVFEVSKKRLGNEVVDTEGSKKKKKKRRGKKQKKEYDMHEALVHL